MKIIKKRYIIPLALVGVVFLGPKETFESVDGTINPLKIELEKLEGFVEENESKIFDIKPENEARIIWADSIRKTEYSVVYLPGFSASHKEGDGVNVPFAQRYGFNIYLARLADHGRNFKDSFKDLSPKAYMDSAKEAIAIGKLLGEKVIVMSCSTGSTHAIYLAANNPEMVDALIMMSPNIDLATATSNMLTMPWGKQLGQFLLGEHNELNHLKGTEAVKYWTTTYHTNGFIMIRNLIDQTMTPETFKKISMPYFLGYYYKNDQEQDFVVSVPAMLNFDQLTNTPVDKKQLAPFPDVGNHVICNTIQSRDVASVQEAVFDYAESVLGFIPVKKGDD